VAGDVADGEGDASVREIEGVVPIAADVGLLRARGIGRVKPVQAVGWKAFGQQGALQGVGDVPFSGLHPRAVDGECCGECELIGDE